MILTVTPNPLLDYIIHSPVPPAQGGHRTRFIDWTVGGKGINVARMLKTFGRPALAMGFAGGPNGEKIRQKLKDQGVSALLIPTEAETRVGINMVVENPPDQTWWIEDGEELLESEIVEFLEMLERELPRTRFVAMSGTIPGKNNRDLYRRVIERCRRYRCDIFLDARGEPLRAALEAGGFFLKHNRDEARETFGLDPFDESGSGEFFERLSNAGIWGALITDGPRDAPVWEPPHLWKLRPPEIREVSAIGSGDAAMAGLLWAYAKGFKLLDAARWAMAAGAADALHPGPCEAEYQEIERRISEIQVVG